MVDISCIKCGTVFSENYDDYSGAVNCPKCGKNMLVTVIEMKVVHIMELKN
ncbi:MAG: hypothetical protein O8C62_11295 [Candidatus Methanoperedens sp.]|nr:hypothetical protein [Candidatus Methanoperedens sp.]